MQTLWQDIRYGLRMLAKNPGFTAVAVATLALGIGANTAIFSLVNAVMLQSIPVRNPQQLVVLRWSAHAHPQNAGSSSYGDCQWTKWTDKVSGSCSFSYPMFKAIREHAETFSNVGAFAGPAQLDLTGNGTASITRAEIVSGDYFQTLGVQAASGRTIEPSDERPGAEAVAVLSYAYWQGAFGGAQSALGKSIKLNGVPFTIVGVADAGFTRLTPGHTQDMWLPLSQLVPLRLRWGRGTQDERNWWLTIVGRLKPGISQEHAQSNVSSLFRNEIIQEKQLKAEDSPEVTLTPAQKALSGIRSELEQPLFILMVAVGIVLLISCANVAGLLLSRAAAREKEIAVRLALGAGRGRVIRQLLTESVLLSFAGAALGVLLAYWGASALAAFASANRYSNFQINADPDVRVLALTVGVAALTGILFGLAPAFRGARVNVAPTLKENAGSMSGTSFGGKRRFGLGSGLVVAQVALSLIVLAGAGLVVRSLANLKAIDPGFDTQNVLQFGVNPTLTGYYKSEQVEPLYRELQSRLSGLPGVISVSYSSDTLLDGGLWTEDVKIERRIDKSTVETQMLAVGPEFFSTMRIPVMTGRTLTHEDSQSKRDIAVVNRAFVKKFLDNRAPLGLHFGGEDPKSAQYEIVGVVGDTKYAGLRDEIAPTAFIPLKEGDAHFALKTAINPQTLLPGVRKVVSDLDSNLPLFDVRTQTERIERLLFNERLLARLATLFGLLALVLACIGLYGLLSYEVARRTREIGIRAALGAQNRDVLRLVGRQGLVLVALGIVFGIVAAMGVTRSLGSLLYGVQPSDPITFFGVCALLTVVGLAACYIPARRAARVDPMVALRYE
ncbi:MAG TPA: ABC transporter permease [Candidatus Binatus sp.]|nr:ABC transporter permease [Candidatus Binatus sp.]